MKTKTNERKNFFFPIHSMIVVVFSLLNGIFFLSFTKQLDEILMVMNKQQQQQLEKEMNQMKEKKIDYLFISLNDLYYFLFQIISSLFSFLPLKFHRFFFAGLYQIDDDHYHHQSFCHFERKKRKTKIILMMYRFFFCLWLSIFRFVKFVSVSLLENYRLSYYLNLNGILDTIIW